MTNDDHKWVSFHINNYDQITELHKRRVQRSLLVIFFSFTVILLTLYKCGTPERVLLSTNIQDCRNTIPGLSLMIGNNRG